MAYSDSTQRTHMYSLFFAPRGYVRMANLGMQIAQQYLSPFDKLIGVLGDSGSGKSMIIKGMFPGLELTNDDGGVNVRPLPLMDIEEGGFYNAHTYHLDIRFESAFYQMHALAEAIMTAVEMGKRVIVEHFDLVYPALPINAQLLIGVGEEIIVTRPNLFGPEPGDIRDVVFKSGVYRRMAHSAEDLCELVLKDLSDEPYEHADVRHGFVLSFSQKPGVDLEALEAKVKEYIDKDLGISYQDDTHIHIGDISHYCTGPRVHMKSTGEIENFQLHKEFLQDPVTNRHLLVGLIGPGANQKIGDLNKIVM